MLRLVVAITILALFGGCMTPLPDGMTWDSYYASLNALRQTREKAEVDGCTNLGHVSGQSYESVGEAQSIAADKAVRKGADVLYLEEVLATPSWNHFVTTRHSQVFNASGSAFRCK